jgi:hypothetical protein
MKIVLVGVIALITNTFQSRTALQIEILALQH